MAFVRRLSTLRPLLLSSLAATAPPRPQPLPHPRKALLWPSVAALSLSLPLSLSLGLAQAEDGESRPPWETAPARPLRWTALVRALQSSSTSFSAHRRLLPFPLDSTAASSESDGLLWEYRLDFPAAADADILDVFSSLVHAFASSANVRATELATRTVLRAEDDDGFALSVTVPRAGRAERRVTLKLFRASSGGDAPFSATEVAVVTRAFDISQGPSGKAAPPSPRSVAGASFDDEDLKQGEDEGGVQAAIEKLEAFGAQVFVPDKSLGWGALAGYEEEKEAMREAIVLPLLHPEVYDGIARATRERYESLLPRAVLLEGVPGCGKSTAARVIAAEIGRPFVVLNVESILSKYFGETTTKLAEILATTRELGPCVLFCDEVDSLGSSRDDPQAHEVTRRTLSVLLRFLDGIDGPSQCVMVAATNVKHLLDQALRSRFDVQICMGLPDATTRSAILEKYARQLTAAERETLGQEAEGFSGRELHDACKTAERACAGRAVRAAVKAGRPASSAEMQLPLFDDYLNSIRLKAQSSVEATRSGS